MKQHIKNLLKKMFYKIGLDVYRFKPSSSPQMQTISALKKKNINLIFDIGANIGQFAKSIRSAGYNEQIVSFEPLSSAHTKLSDFAAKDEKWIVHDQCAIGDFEGFKTINISRNSVSSSLLSMHSNHQNAAPASKFISKEKVSICKLDNISAKYFTSETRLLVKIDTQGYEWEVINGAKNTILKSHGIICELSLVALYHNQKLWRDIIDRLEAYGFMLWAIQKGLADPITGQTLQVDGIFLRKDK